MSSSSRKIISSFVEDDSSNTCMQRNPKPLGNAHKFQIDGHFRFSEHVQNSNFIGDYVHIQDGPRAVSISETGEILRLGSNEETQIGIQEKSDGKEMREKIDHKDHQRKRRSKPEKKLRPTSVPRISTSTHSELDLKTSKSVCSNVGTQTNLVADAFTKAQHRGPESASIPQELPSPQLNHQVTPCPPCPSTVTIPEPVTQASFYKKDFWNIFALLSMLLILLWIASDYLELNGVREYMVNKLRGVDVKSDPPKSKYEIVQEFITKLLL